MIGEPQKKTLSVITKDASQLFAQTSADTVLAVTVVVHFLGTLTDLQQ
jgi:hypothetical protein